MSASIVLAAGGTAGHVNPMLALAYSLVERGHAVRAVGTKEGLEYTLVPAAGIELVTIPRVPLPRRPSMDLLRLPMNLRGAVREAGAILDDAKAEALVGFGGYVSAPAYLAARSAGIPIVIHEQNARPGIANRLGARFASGVALTFPGTNLRARRGVTEVTGLPLRPPIAALVADRAHPDTAAARRAAALARFGLDPSRPVVLLSGGSSGAQKLNRSFSAAAEDAVAAGLQVLHVTGKGKEGDVAALGTAAEHYHVIDYLTDMEEAYACADLVITRAGAGMVAELAALRLPAVVVPLPIGNGEQYLNATAMIAAGGFVHITDEDFTPDAVRRDVIPFAASSERLGAARDALAGISIANGAEALADMVESVIHDREAAA